MLDKGHEVENLQKECLFLLNKRLVFFLIFIIEFVFTLNELIEFGIQKFGLFYKNKLQNNRNIIK